MTLDLKVSDLGIVGDADISPCLSIGARFFRLDSQCEIAEPMLEHARRVLGISVPEAEFQYYGLCFGLSFHEYSIRRHFIAPDRAELGIKLYGGYCASDGQPRSERELVMARVKYSYGSKVESSSKLNFKLGWEQKDIGTKVGSDVEVGEKLSNDYSILLETDASTEYCTALYINPFTDSPGWIFERSPSQRILKDTRHVWLMVEAPSSIDVPLKGSAELRATFRKVKETEKVFESLTGAQHRILEKIAFSRARTWLEKDTIKRAVRYEFDLSEEKGGNNVA